MHFRLRLPGGTLKIKSAYYLRTAEQDRQVPVLRLFSLYLIWWPHRMGP